MAELFSVGTYSRVLLTAMPYAAQTDVFDISCYFDFA